MSKVRANNWANRLDTQSVSHDEVFAMPRVMADYATLRAYAGQAIIVQLTEKGANGLFVLDADDRSSADNGGTTIVSSNGSRWKRNFIGAVRPEWFGAKCNGTLTTLASIYSTLASAQVVYPHATSLDNSLDWAATQAAINYARSLMLGGKVVLSGAPVISHTIDCHPSVPVELHWEEGCTVYTTLIGASSVLFKGTHPLTPSIRGKRLVFTNPNIAFHSSVPSTAVGCVFIEHRYASNMKIQGNAGVLLHYRNNTVIRASGLFNCDFDPVTVWGGGVQKPWKVNSAIRYSINSGSTALSADADIFDAGDVGKVLVIQGNNYSQKFTIASVTDARNVTVTTAAMANVVSIGGNFETIRGSINASSTTLTMEKACLDATDVGRVVYVLNARTGFPSPAREPLRATIVSVESSTSCTLSTAASSSITNTHVVFSPGTEFYGEDDASSNDFNLRGFHTEEMRGTCLVITRAGNVSLPDLKLHALNNFYSTSATQFRAVFSSVSGHITGDFEGTCNNALGDVHISGQSGMLTFDKMTGVMANDGCLIYAENNSAGAIINVGDWNINNPSITAKTLDNAFRLVGSGNLYQKGSIAAYAVNYTRPDIWQRKVVFGKNPPALSGQVAVAMDTAAARLDLIAAGSGNSPFLVGSAYGGTFDAPADAVDFQTALSMKGMINAGGALVDGAGILYRARTPTGSDVSCDMVFYTRSGGAYSSRWSIATTGGLSPSVDNATPIGSGSARISQLYAGTATINTSDERYKEQVQCVSDAVLDAWSRVEYQQYKFVDAVTSKKEGSRWHIGVIAQRVESAFAEGGLDAREYGLLCHDVWEEQPEITDANGVVIQTAVLAGDRYGIRYEEALALESALMRRTVRRLEARLTELEVNK